MHFGYIGLRLWERFGNTAHDPLHCGHFARIVIASWIGPMSQFIWKAFRHPRTVHRMSRLPINLKAPCLAGLWLTQPDKLQSLLDERSLNEGGLIPRILACHTNAQLRRLVKTRRQSRRLLRRRMQI